MNSPTTPSAPLTFPTFKAAATVADGLRHKLHEGTARLFDPTGAEIRWWSIWGAPTEPASHLYISPSGTDDTQPRRLFVELWGPVSTAKSNDKPLETREVARFEDVTPAVRPAGYVNA